MQQYMDNSNEQVQDLEQEIGKKCKSLKRKNTCIYVMCSFFVFIVLGIAVLLGMDLFEIDKDETNL